MKNAVKLPIENITPFTLLDFPDNTACILWFAGCNMKCSFCYNPEIVFSNGKLAYDDALKFLRSRIGLLDGVVMSGGECTTKKDFVPFVEAVRSLGFSVKVDTNGLAPRVLEELIAKELIAFVSLDFKSPPSKFNAVTGSNLFARFEETLKLLLGSALDFEVRTTFHEELLTQNDIEWMGDFLVEKGYRNPYYIQHFINDTETIGKMNNNYRKIDPATLAISDLNVVVRS